MNRRHLLQTAALWTGAAAALAACAGTSLTPAVVIADAQSALAALKGILPNLSALIPAATLGQIGTDITAGQGLASSLSSNLPATSGATVLQQVEGYLNAALTALAGFPLIPPPYSTIIQAAAVVLPSIEAWVNSVVAQPTAAASPRVAALARGMTLAQARSVLAGAR
jgi:hypothetical protein